MATGVGEMLASAVIKEVVGKLGAAAAMLGSGIGDQAKLLWRFKDELEDMKDELATIQAVLKDAESRSINEEGVNRWLKKLKNAAYDISNMLDEFEANTQAGKMKFFSSSNPYISKLTMGNKIRKMTEKLRKITEERKNYGFKLNVSSDEQEIINERETTSSINNEVIGRKREKDIIISMLQGSDHELTIAPIYGLGGMGKTTLAKMVFNDESMQDFELRAWVYVSPNFDLRKIKEAIISQAEGGNHNFVDQESAEKQLKKIIDGKRCLIVLDDIWEGDEFNLEKLKTILKGGKKGSKIIVTTCNEQVARKICTVPPLKLEPLCDEDCWQVFKQSAFQSGGKQDELEKIGREIAKNCKGVALAAKSLGFMLRLKEVHEWIAVRDSHTWDESSSEDRVLSYLKLSYNKMPSYLKLCFAYCSIFPKGSNIRKDDLIQQWIALGFIQPHKSLSPKQLGEKYVKELMGMSFLEPSKISLADREHEEASAILNMHDLVHDLAKTMIGDEVLVLDGKLGTNASKHGCRYALLIKYDEPSKFCKALPSNVRALHFKDCSEMKFSKHAFSFAKCLRVLDISKCPIKELPTSIGRLKQLRYLDASGMQEATLPKFITSLSKLHYLNLHGSSRISVLPKSISKLGYLQHLDLSSCTCLSSFPESFGDLKDLSLLSLANCPDLCKLPDSLVGLLKLESLNLSFCYRLLELPESLGNLHKLRLLDLSYCSKLVMLPESLGKLKNLRHLDISRCYQLRQPPELFGNLNALRHLNMSRCYTLDLDIIVGCLCNLTNLEYLNLANCDKLSHLPESVGNLKKLHTLNLSYCLELTELPQSIRELPSLKSLLIKNCSIELSDQVKQLKFEDNFAVLCNFMVRAEASGACSNILHLDHINPEELKIEYLEDIKSLEEVKSSKLLDKSQLSILALCWTPNVKHFVEDEALLAALQPPQTLVSFELCGYMGTRFPSWTSHIASSLTGLVIIIMDDLTKCDHLPPLGQLPKLQQLYLGRMPNIRKLDGEFCGGTRAFRKLEVFTLKEMESLEEWTTKVSSACYGEEGEEEFMFPNLQKLKIWKCPKLRLKPCLPTAVVWEIGESDAVISSWREGGYVGPSFSSTSTRVSKCKVPPDGWRLLSALPALQKLEISSCQQSSLPESVRVLTSLQFLCIYFCNGLVALPEWLGDLTSLRKLKIWGCESLVALPELLGGLTSFQELKIWGCESLKSLPQCMQHFTTLEKLEILGNDELRQWCESEENKMKLAHIKQKIFSIYFGDG